MTRCFQTVAGYLTPYSVSPNETPFDRNISQPNCVFQIMWSLEEENDSPLHLMKSTGFWRHNWSTVQNMTLKCVYFFEWHQSGAKGVNLYHCYAGEIKLNAWFTSQSKSKQTCQLAPSSIWTRKYSTYRQQHTGGKCCFGERRWQPQQNLLNSVVYPYISASECRSIGTCSNSGSLQGSRSQVSTFNCHSLWYWMPEKGYQNNFTEPVL